MTQPASLRARLAGDLRSAAEIREAVYLFDGDAAVKQSRFWLLLVLSTTIATAGIVSDSTATVIGAMIIAPLATPIHGVAAAIAAGEPRPLMRSAGLLLAAAAVVVVLAAGVAWIMPTLLAPDQNSQITGRVSPTLVDLVAAAATGLAGAFAIARRDIGDILPGVAIAISLVPPLAVVGVTGIDTNWSGALGALLLFLTNVLAMIVLGTAVFAALGALRAGGVAAYSRPAFRRRRVLAVVGSSAVVVVAALALTTYRTVELSNWRDAATDVGTRWAREHDEQLLLVRFEGDDLVFVIEGHGSDAEDRSLAERLDGAVPKGTAVFVNRVEGGRSLAGTVP